MKAVTIDGFDSRPALQDDASAPTPAANEVVVRVHASSANPVDNAIAAGMLEEMVEHEFPVTLGRDYSGVVEEVGGGVTELSVGDEVFGFVPAMKAPVHDGGWAERIAVPVDGQIARKPDVLDAAAAGAAPLAAVTAMAAVDALDLSSGDTVLVVGASGGVGSFAVQLAVAAGAIVIAPALADDAEYLVGLGVHRVLPREGDVVAAVREDHPDGVDALLDTVSYEPGTYDGALKDGARVASPNNAAGESPGRTNVMSVPAGDRLDRVARLLAAGALTVPIHETYELGQAGEALRALAETHTRGKLAISVE